jgi:predicted O-linked N-acetylglucosamine transferase (SPINDLY family)
MNGTPALAAAIDAALGGPKPQHVPFWERADLGQSAPPRAMTPEQMQASRLMDESGTLVKFRQYEPAAAALLKACSLWPTNPDILYQCGCVLLEMGRNDLALVKFDAALSLRPRWSDCHNNKSAALARMGRSDEAIQAAHAAIEAGPNVAALANLCAAYSAKGLNEQAISYGEQAIKLSQGTNAMALINYGVAKRAVWDLDEAAGAQERAIELGLKQPSGAQDHMAWSNLGAIRNLQGRNHEALAVTQRAAEIAPQNATILGNMIMFMDLLPETTLIEALARRRHWSYLYEQPMKRAWPQHKNDRDPNKKLRVGYVGADFRQHSAAHIHGAIIRAHDPEQVAVYVYAGNMHEDAISAKIREAPALEAWVTTARMTDTDLAQRVYADRIDILVDVAGFTSGGRLATFACKPAPIQACAWGYANGTGLDAMDVFLADGVIVPPELEHGYHETVVRMSSLLTFDPFLDLPAPQAPPKERNGYVTFGSYNRVEKISAPILQVWCEVMKAVPDSRMVLKFGGLQGATAEGLRQGFESHGISRDRVEMRGHTPREEHLRQYGDIDVMLDSWPHVGGITTLEALWMGVPCVTLLGPRAPSRVSASILHTLGMDDWVTTTPEQYVAVAVEKAASDLSELRAGLPDRVKGSVVGNPEMYTRELEQVYRQLWQAWVTRVTAQEAA